MKTQSTLIIPIAILFAIAPLVYLWSVYDVLPATVATHYGINGPDKFGEKSEMWGICGLLSGVSIFVFFLLWNLNKIDPKKTAKLSLPVFRKFALLICFFIAGLNFLIIQNTVSHQQSFQRYLPALIGVFFAVLGNFMHSVKPNYFVGVRTPWTLENELVWKKTHQLAGKLFFAGGIIIAASALLLPVSVEMYFMFCSVAVIALVPVIYSYTEHKRLMKQVNNQS